MRQPLTAISLALLLVACGGKADTDSQSEGVSKEEYSAHEVSSHEASGREEHKNPHFGYEGAEAPSHWGSLHPDWAACDSGHQQSPVDLADTQPAALPDLQIDYRAASVERLNNGHSIQMNCPDAGQIGIAGESYDLLQFHFHAPSEHTVNGRHSPLEMHLVHANSEGQLAVLGVMLEEGAHNEDLAFLWRDLPLEKGPGGTFSGFDPAGLLPADRDYVTYGGSLTTPPCTEGVTWIVLNDEVTLSAEQITAFTEIYEGNNRPAQPLGDRTIQRK